MSSGITTFRRFITGKNSLLSCFGDFQARSSIFSGGTEVSSRGMLRKFEKIFVQDKQSLDLLAVSVLTNVIRAGDTRFDRVVKITGTARDIPQIEKFRGDEKLLLAGSSWKRDEEIIARYINLYPGKMKWIFAPHEIDKPNIDRLEKLLMSGWQAFGLGSTIPATPGF